MARKALMIIVIIGLIGFVSVKGRKFDAELGNIKLHFTQHNPIYISLDGTKDGFLKASFQTGVYDSYFEVKSDKRFDLSQTVLVSKTEFVSEIPDGGNVITTMKDGERTIFLAFQGKGKVEGNIESKEATEQDTKMVNSLINLDAKKGTLYVNLEEEPDFDISSRESISRKLSINEDQARELLNEYSERQINYALKKGNSISKNRNGHGHTFTLDVKELEEGGRVVAGGGGSLAVKPSTQPVNVGDLSLQSAFNIFLENPAYKGFYNQDDSTLYLRLFEPKTNTPIKGLSPNITITGPLNESPDNIVILDSFAYDNNKERYFYSFDRNSWFTSPGDLKPGDYKLFIDINATKTIKIAITITDEREIIPK